MQLNLQEDTNGKMFLLNSFLFSGYFNSTLNPVIYAMTNRDFKLAFIGILKRILCCQCSEESRRNSDNF